MEIKQYPARKYVTFLLGQMGAGKSTLLKHLTEPARNDYYTATKEGLNVLGTNLNGADTLSSYKKDFIYKSIQEQQLSDIVIAGVFYNNKTDFNFFLEHGYQIRVLLLNVPLSDLESRIKQRGGKELKNDTFKVNTNKIKNILKLAKQHGCEIKVLPNATRENIAQNLKTLTQWKE